MSRVDRSHYTCDRCGGKETSELGVVPYLWRLGSVESRDRAFDLCRWCGNYLERWLRPEEYPCGQPKVSELPIASALPDETEAEQP